MLFLLYRHADDGVFDNFPKIFQNCSKYQTNVPEHFPRISKNFQRCPKTSEEDPKMFPWYTNELKYNLRDKPDVIERIDKFTCEIMENKPLGSRM